MINFDPSISIERIAAAYRKIGDAALAIGFHEVLVILASEIRVRGGTVPHLGDLGSDPVHISHEQLSDPSESPQSDQER